MEASKENKGSEFHVVLGGLKLPEHIENRVAAGIQHVIDSALGELPNPDDPDGNDGPAGGKHPHGPFLGAGITGSYLVIPSLKWKGRWIEFIGKGLQINADQLAQRERNLQGGMQR